MYKADLQRILINITPIIYDKEILDLKDKAEKRYKKAFELCNEIDDLSSIKARIIIYYCMFVFEENKDISTSYKMANDFYENSNKLWTVHDLARNNSVDPEHLMKLKNRNDDYPELNNLLSVFKANIDIWKNKINQNIENDNVNIHSQDIKWNIFAKFFYILII